MLRIEHTNPQPRGLPILLKVLGVWQLVYCGPYETRKSRKRCPVCDGSRTVEAWATERGPIGAVPMAMDCPACESPDPLRSLLPRDPGSSE